MYLPLGLNAWLLREVKFLMCIFGGLGLPFFQFVQRVFLERE